MRALGLSQFIWTHQTGRFWGAGLFSGQKSPVKNMYITAQKKDWKEIHQNSDSTYFGAVGS